jgi:hypothetical protein
VIRECVIWSGRRQRQGYGVRYFRGKSWLVHRLAWEEAHGPIPDGLCVLHRCDNPPCYNLDHLFLGTRADNIADMEAKGRARKVRGEAHGLSRLSDGEVRELRDLYAAGGVRQSDLAAQFAIGQTTVCEIVRGRTRADAGGLITIRGKGYWCR